MINDVMIEEMLLTNPLSLLAIRDEQVINRLNNLIPYSTGFEIECDKKSTYNYTDFLEIPDIMGVDVDDWEQRYRIPNGLRGIICLYNICYQLKIHSLLNPRSSIHYHVDCRGCAGEMQSLVYKKIHADWILSELDKWLVDGSTAVDRVPKHWFKYNELGTVEFRLGEMTFEYRLILKRIIHCNSMVRTLKEKIGGINPPVFQAPDKQVLEEYSKSVIGKGLGAGLSRSLTEIKNKLLKLEERKTSEEQIVIRKRINKIGDE